jgi:hypothetical protein
MDGALRPNTLLDQSIEVCRADAPDNLIVHRRELFFSSGRSLRAVDPGRQASSVRREFGAAITALAAYEGTMVAGIEDGALVVCRDDGTDMEMRLPGALGARGIAALGFVDANTLAVCVGSSVNAPDAWARDLMERRSCGSVLTVSLNDSAFTEVGGGLAYPCGVAASGEGLVFSEAWRHRLVRIVGGKPVPVLAHLPGYPSRLTSARGGGFWLCVFAPRTQLIEFVLRQRLYRERMMQEVDPAYWVAPSLRSSGHFLEPIQGGAIRIHGAIKSWAPRLSYGLLLRLDEGLRPVASFHSRADGAYHGVTSVAEFGGRVFVTSKGGGVVLEVPDVIGQEIP